MIWFRCDTGTGIDQTLCYPHSKTTFSHMAGAAVSVSRPCINTEKIDYWLINAFYKMLNGSGWKMILFSEFSTVAWSSQSANCPSLRADLWPNEMKSQLTRNGFSNVNSMAPEVFSHISSMWGYVANTSPFPLWAWRVYFTQVSGTCLQHLDGWRDTEKYRISYFKTDCLFYTLIKMEKKSQSHFFNNAVIDCFDQSCVSSEQVSELN